MLGLIRRTFTFSSHARTYSHTLRVTRSRFFATRSRCSHHSHSHLVARSHFRRTLTTIRTHIFVARSPHHSHSHFRRKFALIRNSFPSLIPFALAFGRTLTLIRSHFLSHFCPLFSLPGQRHRSHNQATLWGGSIRNAGKSPLYATANIHLFCETKIFRCFFWHFWAKTPQTPLQAPESHHPAHGPGSRFPGIAVCLYPKKVIVRRVA